MIERQAGSNTSFLERFKDKNPNKNQALALTLINDLQIQDGPIRDEDKDVLFYYFLLHDGTASSISKFSGLGERTIKKKIRDFLDNDELVDAYDKFYQLFLDKSQTPEPQVRKSRRK